MLNVVLTVIQALGILALGLVIFYGYQTRIFRSFSHLKGNVVADRVFASILVMCILTSMTVLCGIM